MAKFVYSMQNILNLNEKLEEQAKMEYATQQMVLNEEEEKEQRLRDRKAAYEDEARRIREDSVNVKEMMLNANAISIRLADPNMIYFPYAKSELKVNPLLQQNSAYTNGEDEEYSR